MCASQEDVVQNIDVLSLGEDYCDRQEECCYAERSPDDQDCQLTTVKEQPNMEGNCSVYQ